MKLVNDILVLKDEARRYGKGCYNLYKGHYHIAFYDKSGENFINIFSTVRDILSYQGKEITRTNVNKLNIQIFRAINWYNHRTTLLDGTMMTIWLVPADEDDEEL